MSDMTRKGSGSRGPSSPSADTSPFEREFPGGSASANASVVDLVRTYDAFITMTTKALSHHGLSGAGRQALAVIEGAGGPLSPTVIAERLLVTTASMTSLLDTLERRGLVERTPDPHDRRRLLVSLTDEGRQVVDAFLPQVVALQTAALARISERDRAHLRKTLEAIRVTIADLDADAVAASAPRRHTSRRP
jgi:DNA-binding MarR family transcriptional regulator